MVTGAVMSVHRMSAAGGFRYLLRHTASADVAHGQQSLVDYYVESRNPPGRWVGSGLAGLVDGQGLPAGTPATEAAMTAVFGRAADPVTGTALGRAFPTRTGTDGVPRPAGVAGYDLTFTVVKSASVLWALGDATTRAAVEAAHHAAVSQVLDLLESRVAATRVGSGGATRVAVRGVVAAAFDHPDTRTGYPNLHSHVVVANRVQAADGVWRTLDGQQLFAAGVALSETYDALVADELARRLPVRFAWRDRGERRTPAFEIDGIPDELLAAFSTRSRGIAPELARLTRDFQREHGRGPSRVETIRLRQAATLASRPVKVAHAWADLLTSWAQRARELTGREPRDLLAAALSGDYGRPLQVRDIGTESRHQLAALAVAGVEARRSTWNGWNLEAEVARATKHVPMASPGERARLHASLVALAREECVALDGHDDSPVDARDAHALSDAFPVAAAPEAPVSSAAVAPVAVGASVSSPVAGTETDVPAPVRTGEAVSSGWEAMTRRYTSERILAAEEFLLTAATTGAGPALDEEVALRGANAALRAGGLHLNFYQRGLPALSRDQATALHHVVSSGRAVQVLVGPAGSGKTATLASIMALWRREWNTSNAVIGLAPSATAAAQLSDALGIRCETLAKWIYETSGPGAQARQAAAAGASTLPRGTGRFTARAQAGAQNDRWRLHAGQLVIVDEATLAGTFDLARIVAQAQRAGAGVLLVGDHHQLTAVEAGGAFGLLARRTKTAELSELWRFTHRWEAEVTRALRDGNPTAIDGYVEHGRVHDGEREAMLTAAYEAWRTDTDAGRESLLIAADNDTVLELNARARTDNLLSGRASVDGVELRDGTTAGVGDRITTRANNRALRVGGDDFVRNGATWTITASHTDGSLTVAPSADAQELGALRLPAEYVAEHVELGYAITAHRAQSRTVDTAHVITGPGMTREHLYVGMTRGRDANHTYVPLDPGGDVDEPHHQLDLLDQPPTARQALTEILATVGAEQSATESMTGGRSRDPQPVRPTCRPQNHGHDLQRARQPSPVRDGLTR